MILLSGGSGKRLWPLSNEVRSKQFLKVLKNNQGEMESMVQRVHRQIGEAAMAKSITIAAGASQMEQLRNQMGESVNILIEPERRDTFPAIALACSYLFSIKGVGREETIVIMPVDSFVEAPYFKLIAGIEEIQNQTGADLVLLGALPLFPSEKYGYIVPKDKDAAVSPVDCFKEKPSKRDAEALIKDGALWNCGVFGIKLGYILDSLKQNYGFADPDYNSIRTAFSQLNKTSFDFEIGEKIQNIQVMRYEGKWKDLGTWETLTEEMEGHLFGNALVDDQCLDTHVINELQIPIVVMGIKNSVIAASSDGIIVAEKGETYKLKDFMSNINGRPMYEERRWGSYMVLDHTIYEANRESLTKKLLIRVDGKISYQYHNNRVESWTILSGQGVLYLNGEKKAVSQGDVIQINAGIKHGIMAITALEIIEVQLGSPLIEDDIVRLDLDW
jgi:mannose-1-phosphate guanylyltransferase